MDKIEMKSLEEKTRAIVETLSNLESGVKHQEEINEKYEQGQVALVQLASELRLVAEQLANIIDLLNKSTLAEDVSRLDDIESSCDELLKNVTGFDESLAQREEILLGRLDALESVIGRIDRNTQKGIGKERG